MKFNWTTLRVKDLNASLDFYCGALGMRVDSRFGPPDHPIVMLGEADGAKLELICDPAGIGEHPGQGVSVGFAPDDLDGLISKLKENPALRIVGPISPNPTIRFFFVNDPDGYSIQLAAQKK